MNGCGRCCYSRFARAKGQESQRYSTKTREARSQASGVGFRISSRRAGTPSQRVGLRTSITSSMVRIPNRRFGSYQPRATPWVHRQKSTLQAESLLHIVSAYHNLSLVWERRAEDYETPFQGSTQYREHEPRALPLGWYERRLWRQAHRVGADRSVSVCFWLRGFWSLGL